MNASAGNLGQPEALYWTGQTGTLGFKVHYLMFKWNKVGHPPLLECWPIKLMDVFPETLGFLGFWLEISGIQISMS